MSTSTWYHASPSPNEASVRERGLLGTQVLGDGTFTVFAIPGQPSALYLVPTLAAAREYVDHVFARWFPDAVNAANARQYLARGARLASFEVWAVEVEDEVLEPDVDWPGDAAVWTQANFPPERIHLIETISLLDRCPALSAQLP